MPRGKYKKYYGVNSTHRIPRSTFYHWRRQNNRKDSNLSQPACSTLQSRNVVSDRNKKTTSIPIINNPDTPSILDNDTLHIYGKNNFEMSSNSNSISEDVFENNEVLMYQLQEIINNDISDEHEELSSSEVEEQGFTGSSRDNSGIVDDEDSDTDIDNDNNFEMLSNGNGSENDTQAVYSNTREDNSGDFDNMNIQDRNELKENETEEEEDQTEQDQDSYFSGKLCDCTQTTRGDLLSMVMCLAMQHSLTWTCTMDILSMVNKLYVTDIISAQKHKLFRKYFPIENDSFTYHIYCPLCEIYVGIRKTSKTENIKICDNCHTTINTYNSRCLFMTLNMKKQLETLLKNKEVQNNIFYQFKRRKHNIDAIEDVYDGDVYQKFQNIYNSDENQLNLSYVFNTDGCQSAESSKVSIWPIYIMLNELPLKLRKKYIILAGLWVQPKQPPMNVFLQPFIEEANVLATNGINWVYNGEKVNSKVFALGCCVDSCARCCMLNMKKFNGIFGCTFCEHPTENVDGFRKFTMSSTVPPERTDSSIRRNMYDVYVSKDPDSSICGVHGPSALMNLRGFDLRQGMIVDYMHSVLLGVAKQYTEIILTSVGEEYYLGDPNQLAAINRRLGSIRVPNIITRTPRSICDRKLWKASEYRSWLLFYSLPCLYGILPQKYLYHLALLVAAIEILLRDSITQSMLKTAERLLIRFVVYCQVYLGKKVMTYNIHLLLHLVKDVQNWGPLSNHNAFCFENENRVILALKTSPFEIATQITGRYMRFKSLPLFISTFAKNDRFREFCEESLNNHVKEFIKTDDCILIGSGKDYILSPIENELVPYSAICLAYKKLICNGIRYTSELYKRPKKTNDCVIITSDDRRGIITNICKIPESPETFEIVIYFRKITIDRNPFISQNSVNITHIKKCFINSNDNNLEICKPSELKGQCILMQFQNYNYIVDIPRGCYGD